MTPPDNQPAGQDAVLDKGVQVVLDQLANPSATFPPPVTPEPTAIPAPSASPVAITGAPTGIQLSLAVPIVLG